MINIREIIPSEIINLVKKRGIGNYIDKVIDRMNNEVHESNTNILMRHETFVYQGQLDLNGKTIKEAKEYLSQFDDNAIIEDDYCGNYNIGIYRDETDDEYVESIYPLFRNFKESLEQEEENKKALIEERKRLKQRLKEIDKELK